MLQCLPAAAVLGQVSFKSAMKHKAIVAKVATGAAARGRSPLLGVLFDELENWVGVGAVNIDFGRKGKAHLKLC